MSLDQVVSLIVGTLLGLLFFVIAGLGKILPVHPLNSLLVATYDKVVGPFFGLPPAFVRCGAGLAEVFAGLGFLTVVWGELLGLIPTSLTVVSQVLLLCAITGMITIMSGALLFHAIVEDAKMSKVAPYLVFLSLLGAFYVARMHMKQATLKPGMPGSQWLPLVYIFPLLCLAGFLGSLAQAYHKGESKQVLKERNEEIERMKEQLFAK